MRRTRREFSAFSLSFLDIMSCGFGAVVLLFLIIKHQTDVAVAVPAYDLDVEVRQLERDIGTARVRAGELESQLGANEAALLSSREALDEARRDLEAARAQGPRRSAPSAREIAELRATIKRQESDKRAVLAQIARKSRAIRTYVGEGNREYLTGIQLGGRRILVLIDSSASMLAERIVNVIRRRNMDDDTKRRSAKWRQGLATVDWISARFPVDSRYQIYTFDTVARPALEGTRGRWLPARDTAQLDDAINALRNRVPAGGSSLERAMLVMSELDPPPDNVYLITDGLPTQGLSAPTGTTVDGATRLRLFERAAARIPPGIPVNVVLLPMEGDPMAPSAFWQVALYTQGAFLSPASDWP